MHTFPQLIRKIRDAAELTQAEFAGAIGVSAVLIAMIETGQKEVSKRLLLKLAERMNVHPASLTPFLFIDPEDSLKNSYKTEQVMIEWGEKMQDMLIKDRSSLLKKYAKKS